MERMPSLKASCSSFESFILLHTFLYNAISALVITANNHSIQCVVIHAQIASIEHHHRSRYFCIFTTYPKQPTVK